MKDSYLEIWYVTMVLSLYLCSIFVQLLDIALLQPFYFSDNYSSLALGVFCNFCHSIFSCKLDFLEHYLLQGFIILKI